MQKLLHWKQWKDLQDQKVPRGPEALLALADRAVPAVPAVRSADLCRRIGRLCFQCCGSCEIAVSPAVASRIRADDLAKIIDASPSHDAG